MTGERKIILGNGKTATAQGNSGYGFDDIAGRDRDPIPSSGYGPNDIWERAKKLGLSDPSQPISHRVILDSKGAVDGAKTDPKFRVFVEKGTGRLLGGEEIESDEKKPLPLTSYRSSFTEEVFSGIAAPHINQVGASFCAYHPSEWDIGAFSHAILDESLSGISVPEPLSVFQIIDAAEGNDTTQSQFYTGAGTSGAPLRAVAQQESTGTICVSLSTSFQTDQAGLTALLGVLETSSGFKEGQNASNRIMFNGIRWAGMLQYDNAKLYANWYGGDIGVEVEMSQPLDPRVIENNRTMVHFRMYATFIKIGNTIGTWRFSVIRDTKE